MRAIHAGALVAMLWSMVAFAEEPVGEYAVSGTNPGDRGTYSGTATIERTGETYRVVWQIGSDRYVGTAIGNNEFLAISYTMGSQSGLAMYSASGAGWKGIWTYANGRQIGTEIWSRR
jgi:hypothetical protein